MEQFNQWSIKETVKEIKSRKSQRSVPKSISDNNFDDEPQISQIKFQRKRV